MLLSFLVSSTSLTKDLALTRDEVSILLGIALAVPLALMAGAMVWTLPETKGVRLID